MSEAAATWPDRWERDRQQLVAEFPPSHEIARLAERAGLLLHPLPARLRTIPVFVTGGWLFYPSTVPEAWLRAWLRREIANPIEVDYCDCDS